jgi:hypothetical protein
MPLSRTGRLRTYTGLKTAARRLDGIMASPARWSSIADALPELRGMAEQSSVFNLGPA